jgi:hypothetical protein
MMTRRRGLALGIGITMAVSYIVAAIGFFGFAPALLRATSEPDALDAVGTGGGFGVAMLAAVAAAFAIAVLQIGYMVHAARSRLLSRSRKALWETALLLGSVFVMPFYWYLYIWRPAVLATDDPRTDEQRFAVYLKRRSEGTARRAPPRGTA